MVIFYPLVHWKATFIYSKILHKNENKASPSWKEAQLVVLDLGFVLPHFGKSKSDCKEFRKFNENRLFEKASKFLI